MLAHLGLLYRIEYRIPAAISKLDSIVYLYWSQFFSLVIWPVSLWHCHDLHEKHAAMLIKGPHHRDHCRYTAEDPQNQLQVKAVVMVEAAGLQPAACRQRPPQQWNTEQPALLDPFISWVPRGGWLQQRPPYMKKELQAPIIFQCRLFTSLQRWTYWVNHSIYPHRFH